jgi:ribosomal protein S27AE
MKFLDNLKSNTQNLAEKARKNVDVKKLEFVIKGVKKENTLLYAQIGKLVYTCQRNGKPIVMSEIEALCAQIDGNRLKVAGLESKINDINEGARPAPTNDDLPLDVAPISKNERDLRLVRTDNGVRFMKFCPKCGGANEPDSKECASCGYSFTNA